MVDARTFGNWKRVREAKAFTLVEFILVMALMTIVIAIAAPKLSKFFRGRKLESEARRFVALARHGQAQAVSEGLPMILWIDRLEGTYGLRGQDPYVQTRSQGLLQDVLLESSRLRGRSGFETVAVKEPAFHLAENLRFNVEIIARTNSQIVTIRFLPDGAIDEESLRVLQILEHDPKTDQNSEPIWIAQSRDQSRYEIVDRTNVLDRINPPEEIQGGIYLR